MPYKLAKFSNDLFRANLNRPTFGDVWVLGNGETLKKINIDNFKKILKSCSEPVLACCNGFFYKDDFAKLFKERNIHFFVSDPYIHKYLKYLARLEEAQCAVEDLQIDDNYVRNAIDSIFKDDLPIQAKTSLHFDIYSIHNALKLNSITWNIPYSWAADLESLSVKNINYISPYALPSEALLSKKILSIFFPKKILRLLNPLGPAILNIAILYFLDSNTKSVNVLGHNDNLNFRDFDLTGSSFKLKYDYWWTNSDTFYHRADSFYDYVNIMLNNMIVEKTLQSRFGQKLTYFSKSHFHFYCHNSKYRDLLDE